MNFVLWIKDCELWIVNFSMWITNCGLSMVNYELEIMIVILDFGLWLLKSSLHWLAGHSHWSGSIVCLSTIRLVNPSLMMIPTILDCLLVHNPRSPSICPPQQCCHPLFAIYHWFASNFSFLQFDAERQKIRLPTIVCKVDKCDLLILGCHWWYAIHSVTELVFYLPNIFGNKRCV